MCKFNGTKLNKYQYVLLTGCKVKGENALYKVTRDIANDENYLGDNGYLLEKVKLNGEIKTSGYTLYFYDNNGIKHDPEVIAKPLNSVTELKEANKELKAYLISRDNKTIVNKINGTDIKIDLNAVGTEYKVKMINQVKFSTNGYNNNKAFKKDQYFKIKVIEGQRIRTELLNKTCESYCFDTAMKYSHGLNKNLTQEFINNCFVIEIDKITKESLKETEKEVKKEEVKPVETIEEQNKVKTESSEIVSTQQTVANEIEFTVNETIENVESIQEPQKAEQQPKIIINEELAKRAKENMSFNDYEQSSATNEYNRVIEDITQKINEAKKQVKNDSEKISQLDYLLIKFKKDYANWTNKHNANGANHVSIMISGAGNYNMNKHNKYVAKEGKLWAEYNDIMAIDDKIDKVIYSKKIIKSSDKDALDKLKEKLAEEQKTHDEMVNHNKQARKDKKEVYATYVLSNSSQRIKNIKDRISQLEKLEELKQTKGNTEIEINGINIIDNLEANRVQMIFEGKPSEEVRKILKSNGFRWSPSFGAWQRNRNNLSMMKAKNIAESLNINSVAV